MRLHFSDTVTRPAPAPERIARSILMGAALMLGVVGCPPVPPDDSDAGVGGSTMGGSATGGVVTGGTTSTGGAGAGGESGSAGSAGAGSGACSVPEQSAPPFTTTFRFTNPGPDPRRLSSNCFAQIQFDLTSCSDGYQRRINVIAPAASSCYAICPTCQYSSCECALADTSPIAAGSYRDVVWKGDDPVRDTIPTDSSLPCPCTRLPNAPAGLYRISVPVWTSSSSEDPAYTVTRDFTLDHAGGIVEIRL
jgi:hypothetical protein